MITSAFTCVGPYAILIMLGIKRVENRSSCGWTDNGLLGNRPLPSGRAAVSCSRRFCKEEYGNFIQWASQTLPPEDFERIPSWCDLKGWPGKIVGCVDFAVRPESAPYRGVLREAWDEGYRYFWDLSEVVCFDAPIPCKGNTGMWQMPDALAEMVTAADEIERRGDFRIRTPEEAARIFRTAIPVVGSSEGVFVLPLDESGRPMSMPVLVSLGSESTTAFQLKDVFSEVFKSGANRFIVAHNHPGGTLSPSKEDVLFTRALESSSEMLGLEFLDHLIVTDSDFISVKGAE